LRRNTSRAQAKVHSRQTTSYRTTQPCHTPLTTPLVVTILVTREERTSMSAN